MQLPWDNKILKKFGVSCLHTNYNAEEFSFNPLMHNAQNCQTHFKNLAAFAARFLKCVLPFWDIMH